MNHMRSHASRAEPDHRPAHQPLDTKGAISLPGVPGKTKTTGLILRAGLSFKEWRQVGCRLRDIHHSSQWWLGDWCNYGERRFGEKYSQALEATAYDYQTLRDFAYVAGRIELSRRRDNLSFSHHREVAPLAAADQKRWLDRADAEDWNRDELRSQLTRARLEAKGFANEQAVSPPRRAFGAYSVGSKGEGHPVMFGDPKPTVHFDPFPDGGGYPFRFLEWAFAMMGVDSPEDVLHVCSGSVRTGTTVDIRPSCRPKVVGDARALPFRDGSFRHVLADPPYTPEYAENLYGTRNVYPLPGQIVKEASRVLAPGGHLGLLHFQVPMIPGGMRLLGVWGITQGSGYRIRAWSLLERTEHSG